MHLTEVLERVSQIHAQLAKGEVYRGYRPLAVALAGGCGILGLMVQPLLVGPEDFRGCVLYWMGVAAVACLVGGGATAVNHFFREDEFARRRTRHVLGQFLPCLVVGAILTAGVWKLDDTALVLLPGLWAVVFSLGLFASRPYLPAEVTWGGWWYLVMGSAFLAIPPANAEAAGWMVGGTFGAGHLMIALILYRDQRRLPHDGEEGTD
jgi:hypothetical protein